MVHPLNLLERPQGTRTTILPLSTTPHDIRRVVQLLKKKPDGITLNDISDGVFDPRKVAAYELLEIVVRSGKRVKLSSVGWELGRKLEPETQIFRFILSGIEPYRLVLEWAHRHHIHVLAPEEVAEHWLGRYPGFFDGNDYNIIESMVVCFFHLCGAAALGYVADDTGQMPVRLLVDDEELTEYITDEPLSRLTEATSYNLKRDEIQLDVAPKVSPSGKQINISISGGSNLRIVALKVLTQTLVQEVESLNEPQNEGTPRKISLSDEVRRFEAELIRSALVLTGGRQRRAANLLSMSKTALNAKIKRYNITGK